MATSRRLAVVRDDRQLPDVLGASSSYLVPTNSRSSQRLANILDTGLGRIDNASQLMGAAEAALTRGAGEIIRDYTRVHDLTVRSTLAFEKAYPNSPYDLRAPMGDILSDVATQYRALFNASADQMIEALRRGSTLPRDDRHWAVKLAKRLPEE